MIKNGKQLADACLDLAKNYKTLYVLGVFGWPMNPSNQKRAMKMYAYNRKAEREEKIRNASEDTFGFDCSNMIKALLWGWNGDGEECYGGAIYLSCNVPDKTADMIFADCLERSDDFSNVQVGEAVWLKGHIGIYVGGGLAVECTPKWDDGVQITAVHNQGKQTGYNGRFWTSHGKLPWISYSKQFSLVLRQLKNGDKGEDVRSLQQLLIAKGYSCGKAGADGVFGRDTDTAVRGFQAERALAIDGIAGMRTMRQLMGVNESE